MTNALTPILATTRDAVARRRSEHPAAELERIAAERLAGDPPRQFTAALADAGRLSVIAEHKRSSPSAGAIRTDLALEDVVTAYERGGAAALSVLTEPESFGGSLQDLARARAATALPVLRKDFIVDHYQVLESLAHGADAILLIVAALTPAELRSLHDDAVGRGLGVLVEVHDHAELEVAVGIEAQVIGVNNRDLTTLTLDVERTFALHAEMPPGTVAVSESGWRDRAGLDRVAAAGIDAVLIGEALMRSPDIEAALRELTFTQA